jgi:hypothetical protein
VRGQRTDIFRVQQSLEVWLPFLDEQWTSACHDASELWRRMQAKGFRGYPGVVSERARRHRRAEQPERLSSAMRTTLGVPKGSMPHDAAAP